MIQLRVRCRPPRRPKKLWDPTDDGGKWLHDKFELLELAPEQDDYQVQLLRRTCVTCKQVVHKAMQSGVAGLKAVRYMHTWARLQHARACPMYGQLSCVHQVMNSENLM